MKTTTTNKCERCGEVLKEDRITWLELSQTDGNYYKQIPATHTSQGAFAFGADCAQVQLKKTEEKTKPSVPAIIEKYFKGERIIYFQQSDRLTSIEGDTYLKYRKEAGAEIWFGGSNGEVCIFFTSDPELLDLLLGLLIYGQKGGSK